MQTESPVSTRQPHASPNRVVALTLAAIGIVYGDIGTSPLYTLKTVFAEEHGLALNPGHLLGIVSLIFWGLVIVVSFKYVTLILRADNHGEGGIMALMALALSSVTEKSRWYRPLLLMGLFGAALFYGDGVITPAISVLSAIEGLEVATPALKPYVVPLTVAILIGLYMMQHHGTGGIGRWFGPIMLVWFACLAAMGVMNILHTPEILQALNPLHAVRFLLENGWLAFIALGSVVLALTGAEALYADMGHFGRRPIRIAWFSIVFPSLALNYLGQGALLLASPAAISNPFFQQLGAWSVYPLVVLSTVATVIASQATISGTFSITHQAISLGVLPRMRVLHTSEHEIGQIYVPLINWIQLAAVLLAVLSFGSSDRLGAAYGIAVTATMLTTTLLTFFVLRYGWRYNLLLCWLATGFFLVIDVGLFSANTLKFFQGGWFPLLLGAVILTIMLTWEEGRQMVFASIRGHAIPIQDFLRSLFISPPPRVQGTAVYFRPPGEGVPHVMLHNLSHNKILHERVVFLTVHHVDIPHIPDEKRVVVEPLDNACYQVSVSYGFKDERDIPLALQSCKAQGLEFNPMETSFFISRQTVVPRPGEGMALWRENLFAMMYRNARDAADYYHMPANRVIELGTQVEI
ncbi:potassium transporter Kup [Noviherbaspirillum sp.]|uniref:potassium transporter Kup n=1 Tax=Noviherbaspirillum sp. TaxID=1926288 RepID=UPI002B4A7515|nr:potassium transporter Kup [Noviherbaspirillum sp.]HJV79346.1 potassium transporter Kup [Noviherbaspirillum sp.]